jgi:hypothetical protein
LAEDDAGAAVARSKSELQPEIIQHAIWLYLRFTLSYRDVEELLAERGLDLSYETVRRWVRKWPSPQPFLGFLTQTLKKSIVCHRILVSAAAP